MGLIAAALVNLTLLALKGAPARGQLLWVLGLHLYAMGPDLLANLPHAGWMDVFLGHDSAPAIPGGAATWLVVAIVMSGAYGWVLSRWLRARLIEAAAGMAPGVGLSGDALTRPQRSPAVTTLAHRGSPRGDVAQVLLLHGLGASDRIWEPVRERLQTRGITTLIPDLLGFGAHARSGPALTSTTTSTRCCACSTSRARRQCWSPVTPTGAPSPSRSRSAHPIASTAWCSSHPPSSATPHKHGHASGAAIGSRDRSSRTLRSRPSPVR